MVQVGQHVLDLLLHRWLPLWGKKQKQFSQASLNLEPSSKATANSVLHMAIRSEGLSKLEQQDTTLALPMPFTQVS